MKKFKKLIALLLLASVVTTGNAYAISESFWEKPFGGNYIVPNDSLEIGASTDRVTKVWATDVDTLTATIGAFTFGALAIEVDDAEAFRVSHADGTTDTLIVDTLVDDATFYDAGTAFMQISPDFTGQSGLTNLLGFNVQNAAGHQFFEAWRGDVGGGTIINAVGISEDTGDAGSTFLIVSDTDDDIIQMSSLAGFVLGDASVDTATGLQFAVQDGAGGTRWIVNGTNGDVTNTGDYFINSGDVTIANGRLLATQGTSGDQAAVFTSANNTDADPTVQIIQNGTAAPNLNVTRNIDDGGAVFNTVFENTNNNATSTTLVGVFAGGTGIALGGWSPTNRNLGTISSLDTVNSTYEQVFHEANDYIFGTGTTFGGGITDRMTISNTGTVGLNNLAPVSGNKLTYTSAGTGLNEIFEMVSAVGNSNFKMLASGAVSIGNQSLGGSMLGVNGGIAAFGNPSSTDIASTSMVYIAGSNTSELIGTHTSGGQTPAFNLRLQDGAGTNDIIPFAVSSTGAISLTGDVTTSSFINLGLLSGSADVEGKIFYDTDDKALSLKTDIAGTTQSVGQEFWTRVINKTGISIPDGSLVYESGTDIATGRPTIALALADVELTSDVLGFTTNTMADGAEGFVTIIGMINDLDTSSFTAGDIIFLSDTVAGGVTSVKPLIAVKVGKVNKVDASTGQIYTTISRRDADSPIYAQLSDSTNQKPTVTSPVVITFNNHDEVRGITHDEVNTPEDIIIDFDGDYTLFAQPQIEKTSGGGTTVSFHMWVRVGTDDKGTTTGVSVANPSEITTTDPHGLTTGQTVEITNTTVTPSINAQHVITVTGANTFTIPVNVTAVTDGVGDWRRILDINDDVADSNVEFNLSGNADSSVIPLVITRQYVKGEKINIMQSVTLTTNGVGLVAKTPAGEPAIPSIIFTINKN